MNIGFDFDGVIVDISNRNEIKSRWADTLYGVKIPAEKFSKSHVVGGGYLTIEQYAGLQNHVYNSREVGLDMSPVPGVLEFLPRLTAQGHVAKVITSREPAAAALAGEWLDAHGLDIDIVGIGQSASKAEAASKLGLSVFVDDEYHKLQNLIGVVAHRFLFTWPYNARVEAGYVAIRVSSWGELYYAVQALRGGR